MIAGRSGRIHKRRMDECWPVVTSFQIPQVACASFRIRHGDKFEDGR
jgi:hypothetical protein